ncbi:hypothetical protein HDR61_02125 [bacterium]|nr:hypothetical protein [bacterium]
MKKKKHESKSKLDHMIYPIIRRMRGIFRAATGPRLRIAYWRENNIISRADRDDWEYRLSADDVIARRIPARVAGRIAQAKVFCKFAAERGLDCYIVCCADYYDWLDASRGADIKIRGRVMMAINVGGHLRLFDGLTGPWPVWYDAAVRPGNFVKALRFQLPYLICAIVPVADFANCDSYAKMRNLYASGDMNNPEFTIKPEI